MSRSSLSQEPHHQFYKKKANDLNDRKVVTAKSGRFGRILDLGVSQVLSMSQLETSEGYVLALLLDPRMTCKFAGHQLKGRA